jgi:hypothetical protein
MKHFRGALTRLFAEQVHNYACHAELFMIFCTKEITYPQASVGPKDNMKRHDSRKQFVLGMLFHVKDGETYLDRLCFLMKQHFMCVEVNTHLCVGK